MFACCGTRKTRMNTLCIHAAERPDLLLIENPRRAENGQERPLLTTTTLLLQYTYVDANVYNIHCIRFARLRAAALSRMQQQQGLSSI